MGDSVIVSTFSADRNRFGSAYLIRRQVLDDNLVIHHVLRGDHEVRPAGRTLESYTFDIEIGGILGVEQDWAIVSVVRVLELGQFMPSSGWSTLLEFPIPQIHHTKLVHFHRESPSRKS